MTTNPSVFDNLRDRIVNGGFEPGTRLRPKELSADYGCSAASVREILFRLSTAGLVDYHEQRGFHLPRQCPEVQHDLTQFRILLECEGACLSIRGRSIAWEARLSAAHHKLSHIESRIHDAPDADDVLPIWTNAEQEFHQTLIEDCGSETLIKTHIMIYRQFRQQFITSDMKFGFVPENIKQHQDILDAALAHDEDLVCERIHAHLSRNLVRPISLRFRNKV